MEAVEKETYAIAIGRSEALREAAGMLEMREDTIRLHAGELNAREMRAVLAVLRWKAHEIKRKAEDVKWKAVTTKMAIANTAPVVKEEAVIKEDAGVPDILAVGLSFASIDDLRRRPGKAVIHINGSDLGLSADLLIFSGTDDAHCAKIIKTRQVIG